MNEEELCRSEEQTQSLNCDLNQSVDHNVKLESPQTSQIKEESDEQRIKEEEQQLPAFVEESGAVCVKKEEPPELLQTEPKEKETQLHCQLYSILQSHFHLYLYSTPTQAPPATLPPPTQAPPATLPPAPSVPKASVLHENSVSSLQKYPFAKRSLEEQMRVKELGPDRPDLCLQQKADRSFADEITDQAAQSQLVLVLRYLDNTYQLHERFFAFLPLKSATAESITSALEEQLTTALSGHTEKLICQAYGGASVMRGVQKRIQKHYPNAHYIHGYAHQLHLILKQATSHIPKARLFFSDLSGFDRFFSKCPKNTKVLDEVAAHRLLTSCSVRWNCHSWAVNTICGNKEELMQCFERIRDSGDFDANTEQEAGALSMLLENPDFNFFLQLFHQILPLVDELDYLEKVRDSVHSVAEDQTAGLQPRKRLRVLNKEDCGKIGKQICDSVLGQIQERFSFTKHLISASLLQSDRFAEYSSTFPDEALAVAVKTYPVITGCKLKTELRVIYNKEELRSCGGAVDLLHVLAENDLVDVLQETVQLLKLVLTTPMSTAEAQRCFPTFNTIKTFVTNTRARTDSVH
ncbi:hypothetical protein WMY93_018074 [Mugilogobius chulae]|uniref:DUF4371 domain-containing protein n=1 Tax=Mugilogobius chulae TaxID=88201 RepID=A0AAW0NT25_9GOBI